MRDGAPSATARLIARGTVLLSKDPRRSLLVPPRAEDLVRADDLRGRYLSDGAVALARGEAIAVSRRPR